MIMVDVTQSKKRSEMNLDLKSTGEKKNLA